LSHTPAHRRYEKPKLPFGALVLAFVLVAALVVAWQVGWGKGADSPTAASPHRHTSFPGTAEPSSTERPAPQPSPVFDPIAGPIDPEHPGFTTLRGNWTRSFQGRGPVPEHPKVAWRVGPWCGVSTDLGDTRTWCGTGWNGTPNVIPQKDGSLEVRVGGYDWNYHFLDGATGQPTHPELHTGDLAKGSATSDPSGYPLYYAGSRDNQFRIIALDRHKPEVLWSMDSHTSVSEPWPWNDDWDGAAQIVGDYMLEGGENSWFYVVKLNRGYDKSGKVTVDPKIVFTTRGWDDQLRADNRSVGQSDKDISVEDSVVYDAERKVVYFGNSGGLVQGWDISTILNGGSQAKQVFRFWTAGENDASIVMDADGMLYVSEHYKPPNSRAQSIGQLVKLDPSKSGNPVIWRVRESSIADDGEAGFFSTPALVGDTLFASANAGDVMAIDTDSGNVYWRTRLAGPLWSGPVVVDGTLVIGDCSGTLYAFDVSNPKRKPRKLWQMTLGGCIETTPAVWDGMIYVGTRAGYEYGISDKNPAKLRRAWEAQQESMTAAEPSPAASAAPSP